MSKNKINKYYILSGFNLEDNNRGSAALGYGAFAFLEKFHGKDIEYLTPCSFVIYKNPLTQMNKRKIEKKYIINNCEILYTYFSIWAIDYWVYKYMPFFSRVTKIHKKLKDISFVAAINGGDGFSDIYGTQTFEGRLFDTKIAIREKIPLIILPQTLGPFKENTNLKTAEKVLKYASKVYIRDTKFESQLNQMGVPFELTKDLSYYMEPEKIDIDIKPNSIGLNVSGLCYSNKFRDLTGCFDNYPKLIEQIIMNFQNQGINIYLLSHSYNYNNPEFSNDDMQASRDVYERLKNKTNIHLIDKELTSPQTKYVISKFKFFIGTRMHANFAAIFTNIPVFGLAYSYKYEGAFDYMGLKNSYSSVLNIDQEDVKSIISKISSKYKVSIV
jgi:polysaccharide pyruvyl transferase WcaK-like protein